MKQLFSIAFIKKLRQQLSLREIKGLPEQIAFNLVMSIVPLLSVIVQIGAYFSLNTDLVKYLIVSYAPLELQELLNALFETPPPTTATNVLLITTALTFFWLISKGFYGITTAANITYQVPLMKFAYLERIFAFLIVCVMIILLFMTLIIYIFGQGILIVTFDLFNWVVDDGALFTFNLIKSLIGFCSYCVVFIFLFYAAPSRKMRIKNVVPGALVTAIGWSLTADAFSFYVSRIAQYSKFYGSLSVIIILLFWLYLLGFTIVIGLQINYILERDSKAGITHEPRLPYRKLNVTPFINEKKE